MSDVTVFKATQDVDDGVGFADVGKKLVAESLTFGGSFYQAGNINEFKLGRYDVFGWTIAASSCNRLSGTATRPVFGSMVQNGKFAA